MDIDIAGDDGDKRERGKVMSEMVMDTAMVMEILVAMMMMVMTAMVVMVVMVMVTMPVMEMGW